MRRGRPRRCRHGRTPKLGGEAPWDRRKLAESAIPGRGLVATLRGLDPQLAGLIPLAGCGVDHGTGRAEHSQDASVGMFQGLVWHHPHMCPPNSCRSRPWGCPWVGKEQRCSRSTRRLRRQARDPAAAQWADQGRPQCRFVEAGPGFAQPAYGRVDVGAVGKVAAAAVGVGRCFRAGHLAYRKSLSLARGDRSRSHSPVRQQSAAIQARGIGSAHVGTLVPPHWVRN